MAINLTRLIFDIAINLPRLILNMAINFTPLGLLAFNPTLFTKWLIFLLIKEA